MPVVVAVVLPAERHVAVVDGKEPMIRDRDPVGVPAHVVQDLPGSTEGRLGVDHPVGRAHRREVLGKRLAIAQGLKRRRKAELAGVEGLLQILEEQAAEQPGQHPHRQEEAGPAGDPAGAIGREPAPGDHAVQMG